LRRRRDPVGALPEVNLIQIQLKNLVFRQDQFHFIGQNELTNFAVEGPFGRQEQRSRQLLGNRAGSFDLAPSAHIRPGRTEHADVVEAGMLEEPDIFDCDDRTPQPFGNICPRGQNATLNEKLTDELLINRIDLRDQAGLIRP
jgi:hypothetical protein